MDRYDERDREWRPQREKGGFLRSFRGRGPKNYKRSDERIADDVHLMLTDDPDIDAFDIEVKVENGEVTLTGQVRSRWEKRAAEDLVAQCSGVADVHNRLKVQPYEEMHIGKAGT